MKIDEKKKLAIFAAALGISRGILYSVRSGDYKPENLAEVFGVQEAEFQIDYTQQITPEEMDRLRVTTT